MAAASAYSLNVSSAIIPGGTDGGTTPDVHATTLGLSLRRDGRRHGDHCHPYREKA